VYFANNLETSVISGFHCEVDEMYTLLGYYAAYRSISLPTHFGNLSVSFQG
jgi:hypothetical protein